MAHNSNDDTFKIEWPGYAIEEREKIEGHRRRLFEKIQFD